MKETEVRSRVAVVVYVVLMAGVIAAVDLLFFKGRFWERLTVNIGIVLVFAAFYFRPVIRSSRSSLIAYATCGAAYTGAATIAVAPRSRGYELAGSGTRGVSAAFAVNARSRILLRMTGSTWSHSSVISPPT